MALLLSVIDEEMARVVCTVVYDTVQYLASLLRVQVVGDEIASENGVPTERDRGLRHLHHYCGCGKMQD